MNVPLEPDAARVAHDPVNDSTPTSAATTDAAPPAPPAAPNVDPAGFRFNLDEALARLSEPHQPIPRFQWSSFTAADATPTADPMHQPPTPPGPLTAAAPRPHPFAVPGPSTFPDHGSRVRPLTQPSADPIPEIREATPLDGTPSTPHWSTLPVPTPASAPPPAAVTPPAFPSAPPVSAPPEPAAEMVVLTGSAAFGAGTAGFSPDGAYAPSGVALLDQPIGEGGPRLPDANPAAAPPMATMVSSSPATPAIRVASVKGRKKKKRRRVGKLVLVLLLLAGLSGATLMFGRDYLFPEDWDKEVVATVDALQLSSGLEFADPVPVTHLPDAEYAANVATKVLDPALGADWTSAVPRWRALGLASGEPTVADVNAAVSAWLPAHYDPVAGVIYRSATATGPALDTAMKNALAAALIDQQQAQDATTPSEPAPASAPVSASASASASLVELAVADLGAELVAGTTPTSIDPSVLGPLPVPIAHRLLAVEDLGAPIVASLDATPDRDTAIAGFDVAPGVLDVPWTAAPVPTLVEGDVADGDAAPRGSDFWYTVLAAYLPSNTAADAANAIAADLYLPAVRGAQQCVYGTFTATTPDVLGVLQISLVAWAEAAPTQAAAQATTLADGVTVQLSTCDPGTAADAVRAPDVAAQLLARQIARLTPA